MTTPSEPLLNSVNEPNWFTKLLWTCAGADTDILRRCPKSDHVKYEGLGGVVLATGVLAFLSGGYAFYTVFSPKTANAIENSAAGLHWPSVGFAILAGFVWSAIIFNIERFIVSSTGKGDGTDKITPTELLYATPRIAMACVFGLCLSKPLEIRILQSEIEARLVKKQEQYEKDLNSLDKAKVVDRRTTLRETIADTQLRLDKTDTDLEARRKEISAQYARLEAEAEGLSATGTAGRGPAWRDKKSSLARLERELERDRAIATSRQTKMTGERDQMKAELGEVATGIRAAEKSNKAKAAHLDGLLARIQIAHELSPTMSWMLTLLLLMIETGPIFFKMMISKSTYDYLKDNKQKVVCARAGIEHHTKLVLSDGDAGSTGESGYQVGIITRIWRSLFGGNIAGGGQAWQTTELINHSVVRVIAEGQRRFETEQILSQEVHREFVRQMKANIQKDVRPFLDRESAASMVRPEPVYPVPDGIDVKTTTLTPPEVQQEQVAEALPAFADKPEIIAMADPGAAPNPVEGDATPKNDDESLA